MEEVAKHNKKEDLWVVVKGLMTTSTLLSWSPSSISPWVVSKSTTKPRFSTRKASHSRVCTHAVSWQEVSTVPTVWEDLLSSAALSTDVLPVTPPATTSSETLSMAAQAHHHVSARSPFTSTPRSQARSPSSGTARAPAQAPSKPSNRRLQLVLS